MGDPPWKGRLFALPLLIIPLPLGSTFFGYVTRKATPLTSDTPVIRFSPDISPTCPLPFRCRPFIPEVTLDGKSADKAQFSLPFPYNPLTLEFSSVSKKPPTPPSEDFPFFLTPPSISFWLNLCVVRFSPFRLTLVLFPPPLPAFPMKEGEVIGSPSLLSYPFYPFGLPFQRVSSVHPVWLVYDFLPVSPFQVFVLAFPWWPFVVPQEPLATFVSPGLSLPWLLPVLSPPLVLLQPGVLPRSSLCPDFLFLLFFQPLSFRLLP